MPEDVVPDPVVVHVPEVVPLPEVVPDPVVVPDPEVVPDPVDVVPVPLVVPEPVEVPERIDAFSAAWIALVTPIPEAFVTVFTFWFVMTDEMMVFSTVVSFV